MNFVNSVKTLGSYFIAAVLVMLFQLNFSAENAFFTVGPKLIMIGPIFKVIKTGLMDNMIMKNMEL